MKKRRVDFIFLFIMLVSSYLFFFTDLSKEWKIALVTLYAVLIFISIYSLMLENRTPHSTLLWMYVLFFFPVVGYIFYLYSGQLYLKGYLFKSKRMNNRETLKRMTEKEKEAKIDLSSLSPHQRSFAEYSERVSFTKVNNGTKARVLKNGQETFSEITASLKNAKHFIHMEYYMIHSDKLGKEIMNLLIEKAKEGVEVRFTFDTVGSISLSGSDVKELRDSGVKVYAFSPIKSGFFNQKFNFRNHRKIIVIDGEVGFVGGLNIGMEYLGENKEIGFWRDTHLKLVGESVQTLHAVFLFDWEYVSGENLIIEERYTKTVSTSGDGFTQIIATGPDTHENMSEYYYAMIACATKSIWISTPYLVPNETIRTALRVAAKKGIDVRIMVPEINDGFLTQYATRSYFGELIRSGIEIYSYQKGFMHQKIVIIDDDFASVGTANMDMRSFHLNFEVNAFLMNSKAIQDLIKHFEEDMEDSELIKPVAFYKRGLIERSKESFARLFSGIL
ncbi:cardiolipin synthase [Priestia flexa]|uniref:cardiolipin synthase n=1 Tax=Priestia flexa TaxID=86664 RepID=UPI00099C0E28|nr:cardiolipin synthase [Priestia flexa]AQX55622.1 cardiolipin synthase [Priestia flexa]